MEFAHRESQPETSAAEADPRVHEAVRLLWQAHEYARDVQRNTWEFAVEIEILRAVGLTNSGLRWLICKGYVEHRQEITLPGEDGRAFHRTGNLAFTKRTCFVLTESGASFARKVWGESLEHSKFNGNGTPRGGNGPVCSEVPHWDRERQELRVGRVIVKQFKTPAPNQEVILAAFEEENWPPRIDDPLPPHPDQDAKRRLHDAINSLNRNQKHPLIRFMGDGSGQGVRWELVMHGSTATRSDSGEATFP